MKYIILVLILCANSAAYAASPKDGFEALKSAVAKRDYDAGRAAITASSYPLFDRFKNYNLIGCLRSDATFASAEQQGTQSTVTAHLPGEQGKQLLMHLIFTEENNSWKLNLPESLRQGIGENWQEQVNAMEQFYLMLKVQLGDKLDCNKIQQIAQPPA